MERSSVSPQVEPNEAQFLSTRWLGSYRGSVLPLRLPRLPPLANQGTVCQGKARSKGAHAVFAEQAETE